MEFTPILFLIIRKYVGGTENEKTKNNQAKNSELSGPEYLKDL